MLRGNPPNLPGSHTPSNPRSRRTTFPTEKESALGPTAVTGVPHPEPGFPPRIQRPGSSPDHFTQKWCSPEPPAFRRSALLATWRTLRSPPMIVKSEIMPRAGWQRSAQESAADGQRHRFRGSSTRVSDLDLGWEHDDSSPHPRRHTFRPALAMTVVLFAVVAAGGVGGGKALKSALSPPGYDGRGS